MFSRFEEDCDVLVRWDEDTRMYSICIRNTPDCLPYDCETIEVFTSQGAIYFLKVLDKMGVSYSRLPIRNSTGGLPMTNLLPSVEREYKDKIRQLQIEKEQIGSVILMEVTRLINTAEHLSEEQKTKLLIALWKGRAKKDITED